MKRRMIRRTPVASESLEARIVPAAMTASVVGGVLTITGSSQADGISIGTAIPLPGQSIDMTRLQLRAAPGSTVNGQSTVVIGGVTAGVKINMGGGNDSVRIIRGIDVSGYPTLTTSLPATNIEMNSGNDSLVIDQANTNGLTWNGGTGDDQVIVTGLYLAQHEVRLGDVSLAGSDGNDSISFTDVITRGMNITGGNQNDIVDMRRVVAGITDINTGSGADTVSFRVDATGCAFETLNVLTGSDNDSVSFPSSKFTAGDTLVDLGTGDDSCVMGAAINLYPPETRFTGKLSVYGRGGNDDISMNVSVLDALFVSMGDGNDRLNLFGRWGSASLNGNSGTLDELLLRPYGTQPTPTIAGFEIRK